MDYRYPCVSIKSNNEPLSVTSPPLQEHSAVLRAAIHICSAFLCFVIHNSLIAITTLNHNMQAIIIPTMNHFIRKRYCLHSVVAALVILLILTGSSHHRYYCHYIVVAIMVWLQILHYSNFVGHFG